MTAHAGLLSVMILNVWCRSELIVIIGIREIARYTFNSIGTGYAEAGLYFRASYQVVRV
jgi:hypothetical protein